MISKLYSMVSELAAEITSHKTGEKRVFLSGNETLTNLTQFCYGELAKDELIEPHLHKSMEEFFYFLSGKGSFIIAEKTFEVKKGVFIRIPHNTVHSLKNKSDQVLQFVYFGIAF